jgi:hypothetical protein
MSAYFNFDIRLLQTPLLMVLPDLATASRLIEYSSADVKREFYECEQCPICLGGLLHGLIDEGGSDSGGGRAAGRMKEGEEVVKAD